MRLLGRGLGIVRRSPRHDGRVESGRDGEDEGTELMTDVEKGRREWVR